MRMIEPLLMSVLPVATFSGERLMTRASGFLFARDEALFVVTSRHVVIDAESGHHPDRVEIVLHTDTADLTRTVVMSLPLYRDGRSLWRQGRDSGGDIDVAVLELDRAALPDAAVLEAFTPAHLPAPDAAIEVGAALLIPGFPLGFHDTRHHLSVVRQAALASAFGVRFQGEGYFLTDARTHRGTSGAPVVMRDAAVQEAHGSLACTLLGVHAARMDMSTRDLAQDESLGLNCAWYADILLTLTEPPAPVDPPAPPPPTTPPVPPPAPR